MSITDPPDNLYNMYYIIYMKSQYTFIRIKPETARLLKIAASLQPQKTSMLALIKRLVDDELQRLNVTVITESSLRDDDD